MLHLAPTTKATVFVEKFPWRPAEVVAEAIARAATLNLHDIQVFISHDTSTASSALIAELATVLRMFIDDTQTLLNRTADADYAVRVRPIELSSRTGMYTWLNAFVLVAIRHRLGHEWLFVSQVNEEPISEDTRRVLIATVAQVCAERPISNLPKKVEAEMRALDTVIASSVEFAIRKRRPTEH